MNIQKAEPAQKSEDTTASGASSPHQSSWPCDAFHLLLLWVCEFHSASEQRLPPAVHTITMCHFRRMSS
jgi:hypothetical protein